MRRSRKARKMTRFLALLLCLVLPLTAAAHEFQAGDLQIIHPHIPAPPPVAKTAAGYMAIANDGTEPDRLIGIEVDGVASAMLHATETSADGMATMMMLDGIEIAPGEVVVFEPGEMHVMMTGLEGPLAEGDAVPATLIFEKAGPVEITFMVEAGGTSADSHTDH